jgi:hypothetical protein
MQQLQSLSEVCHDLQPIIAAVLLARLLKLAVQQSCSVLTCALQAASTAVVHAVLSKFTATAVAAV